MLYDKYVRPELFQVYSNTLKDILESGYNISIVTKNVYAEKLLNSKEYNIKENYNERFNIVILKKAKKEKFKSIIDAYNGKVCIIGNNLSDDIINSYRLGAPFIYIGKSKIIGLILKAINFISFKLKIKTMYNRGIQLKNITQISKIFNIKKDTKENEV